MGPVGKYLPVFLSRVGLPDENGCMPWLAGIAKNGYGKMFAGRGVTTLAHRLSYEHFVGPIPAGLQLDHPCRNRWCVAPSHLEAVTAETNIRRAKPPKSHCLRGHEMTPENTYMFRAGRARKYRYQKCRTCQLAAKADGYRKKKEASHENPGSRSEATC